MKIFLLIDDMALVFSSGGKEIIFPHLFFFREHILREEALYFMPSLIMMLPEIYEMDIFFL